MNPNMMQDPLSQLRDIHLPAPVSWWPLAPGWYILSLVLLIIISLWAWYRYQRRQQQQFQHAVLTELDNYLQQAPPAWEKINLLLKRAAFIHHPRQDIAGLSGEAWLTWLDQQLENKDTKAKNSIAITASIEPNIESLDTSMPFCQGPGRILLTGPYQQQASTNETINTLLRRILIQLLSSTRGVC